MIPDLAPLDHPDAGCQTCHGVAEGETGTPAHPISTQRRKGAKESRTKRVIHRFTRHHESRTLSWITK
jgi:hypothetical protein